MTPVQKVVTAGDSLRLTAEAHDAQNALIPGVQFRWTRESGARFEGRVDETGLLVSGSTGTLPVVVVGILPGEQPKVLRFDVRMVPGPATRIAIAPLPARLVPGQRIRLGAQVFSRLDDLRDDRVSWKSSNISVVRVTEAGLVTAVAAGRASITASVGTVQQIHAVQVLATTVSTLNVTPDVIDARTGDVIRFKAIAKDATGKAIDGLTPV